MRRFHPLKGYRFCLAWLALALTLGSVGCTPSSPTATLAAPPRPTATTTPTPAPPTPTVGGPAEDPVAEELFLLARADLARRLFSDADDITLVEVTVVTWPDTSMGCPQEGETYETVEMPGYRLMLRADDEEYFYHASFETVIYCDAQDEVLPE